MLDRFVVGDKVEEKQILKNKLAAGRHVEEFKEKLKINRPKTEKLGYCLQLLF